MLVVNVFELVGAFPMRQWLILGPPQQERQARFGPCLDFGFQYPLIRNNRSKKIWGRILDLAWLKVAVAALIWSYRVNTVQTLLKDMNLDS